MFVKDYYQILELLPGANSKQIKHNFRRLAKQYHPDKLQGGNADSNFAFSQIQEAYTVLTTPHLREAYMQQRWLLKSQGGSFTKPELMTAELLVFKSSQLNTAVQHADPFRINHHELCTKILSLIGNDDLGLIKKMANDFQTKLFVENLLTCSTALPFYNLEAIFDQLKKIASSDKDLLIAIEKNYRSRQTQYWWGRHQFWLIALVTILLCLMIYFLAA